MGECVAGSSAQEKRSRELLPSHVLVVGLLFPIIGTNDKSRYIYLLDEVLRPAWLFRDLFQYINQVFSLSTFASLTFEAGLDPLLFDVNASLTILAPTDDAFFALDAEAANYLTSPEGLPLLQQILLYHILPNGPYPSGNLPSGPVESLQGEETIAFIADEKSAQFSLQGVINGANVLASDGLANNGMCASRFRFCFSNSRST